MPETPTSITATDADLVAAHMGGDRSALAAIYDRYSDSLYDTAAAMTRNRHDAADVMQDVFVVAAQRLDQLRDPERLKPWLFAILRNEVYRRSGKAKRTVSTDFTDPVAEMSLPSQPAVEASDAEFEELAELVRGAAAGLDERDQLVLEYTVRQGLEGTDLADALGVSAQQCYGLVHRMRQRTERSLGAFCVARSGRKDCAELATILGDWNGEFSVLIRKRVARHVDQCEVCERARRKFAPFAMFGTAPSFAAPPELRQRVLTAVGHASAEPGYGFVAPGGFPTAIKYARRLAVWMTLAVIALLVASGTTAYVLAHDGNADNASAAGGETTTSLATTTTNAAPPATAPGIVGSAPVIGPVPSPASTSTSTSTTSTSTTATPTSSTTIAAIVPPVSTTTVTTIRRSPTPTVTTIAPRPSTNLTTTTAPAASTTTTTTPATTTTTVPGRLTLAGGAINFGTAGNDIPLTLSNTGGQPIDWSSTFGPIAFRGPPSPFTVRPGSGTLAPGDSVDVIVSFDRAIAQEGTLGPKQLTFFAPGTSAQVSVTGTAARPPVIDKLVTACVIAPSPPAPTGTLAFELSSNVLDETFPLSGTLVVTNTDGVSVNVPATQFYEPPTPNDPNDPAGVGAIFNLDNPMLDPDGDGIYDTIAWSFTVRDGHGNSTGTNGSLDLNQSCG